MKLGAYEFEWVPDEMDIPRPEKTVAVQQNLGNVGYFSWGPQLIGKEVKLKWKFCSIAQYAELKAMFLAGGVHVLDLSSEEIYIPPPDTPGNPPINFSPYPDPLHAGVLPGPPYRRFYVGHYHTGQFVVNNYAYWNWSVVNAEWDWPDYNGTVKVVEQSDPFNAYIEVGPESNNFADWHVGDTIFDNLGSKWATVVPYDAALREYYIYPAVPAVSDKIYYRDVVTGFPNYNPTVLNVDNVIQLDSDGTGYCIITELGSDAIGTWFKCRPATEIWGPSTAIKWTAGNVVNVDGGPGTAAMFNIAPWGPVIGGPYG